MPNKNVKPFDRCQSHEIGTLCAASCGLFMYLTGVRHYAKMATDILELQPINDRYFIEKLNKKLVTKEEQQITNPAVPITSEPPSRNPKL